MPAWPDDAGAAPGGLPGGLDGADGSPLVGERQAPFLRPLARRRDEHGKQVATHLYLREINAGTYAIRTADLLLKGAGDAADNIVGGPEHPTLANDAFPGREVDFMLGNPPYGMSWKSDLGRMGGTAGIGDRRFVIAHGGDAEYSLATRSSDGQILFLANMPSKIKHDGRPGSRIA